jgi:hypothetical protein
MEPEELHRSLVRLEMAKVKLTPNYVHNGNWRFKQVSTGIVRDLSAANLDQINVIEDKNLFSC